MSMYPQHPPRMGGGPPNNRFNELLEQIRSEYESQIRSGENYEHQIQSQVSELQLIREKVYAMEQTHMTLKQKFEEEIAHLRRQLEAARGGPQGSMGGPPPHPVQQPPAISGGSGLFNGIMSGAGQGGLAPPPQQQPPQGDQMPPHGQMPPGPTGLPVPPPPPGPSQQPPFQQNAYGQAPISNGMGPQPPQSTASPGPRGRGMGRPPPTAGPATPQISNPMPFPGPAQSPQVSHPTPDHGRMGPRPSQGPSSMEVDPDRLPPQLKKTGSDWLCVFNDAVPRTLDVDLVHTLTHESVVCCVRFSHDGKYVATGCNRSAQIYDVQTGEKICVLQDETADVTGDLYIRSVCFSPDGRYLATGAEDKLIRVWDIQNRTIRNTFSGHEQDIYSLDFARDGRTIASGSGDRTVRLWDIESGSNTFILTIEDGVTTVAISPDTKYVAAGSLDKSVRVWDIHQGYLLERLEGPDGHKDSVYSVAFSPNGKDLVSGSLDKTIKMWELNTPRGSSNPGPKGGRCIKTFEGHRDFVLSVAFTPDGQWVMSGSKDRGVQFWDPRTGSTQLMLQGHKNSVISVAPSPTGGYFATGSGDMRARIWSYRNI
ncbi:Transcriptional repressor rco-1 [Ceratocystis fimbriata CBS 114723]|uniref:Transcriptional repressor rco-1 n=1 Tax=Ceratocystis fimbriata CBS 114723 TaxID=1035309 RepID=A0A2C5WUN3_9PEZI|nr:Transcriptional repressor rco-1 [Ceratocystis fimbriata CBS 114723]